MMRSPQSSLSDPWVQAGTNDFSWIKGWRNEVENKGAENAQADTEERVMEQR